MNKSDRQPFVSILTPVYNGEEYLEESIESVLEQTYQNWEYVIVNNCSTDDSLNIARKYAGQDERIRVHNNEAFLDQMPNLNHAFRQISQESEYCKVVHADDWIFPECVERMVEVGQAHPETGIIGSYRLAEKSVNLDGLPYPSPVTKGEKVCRLFLMKGVFVFGSPTSLLIRSEEIRKRERMYDESHSHGDLAACFEILKNTDFGFVHRVLTFTRRHNESMTSTLKKYETTQLGNLKAVLKYGPYYLSEAEFKKRSVKAMDNHYRFLARKFYEFKSRSFWDYHKEEMKKMGKPLKYGKLLGFIAAELFNFRITAGRFKESLFSRVRGSN
jgi:glycosyltransferase involved in cell wall biosynthesis